MLFMHEVKLTNLTTIEQYNRIQTHLAEEAKQLQRVEGHTVLHLPVCLYVHLQLQREIMKSYPLTL